MDSAVSDQLRILWTTPPYTPHAIAAHPRVPGDVVTKVQAAMTAMAEDPIGAHLLDGIKFKGIKPAENGEWDDVRALDIDLLDAFIKP